jgi:hypothetical protein
MAWWAVKTAHHFASVKQPWDFRNGAIKAPLPNFTEVKPRLSPNDVQASWLLNPFTLATTVPIRISRIFEAWALIF